MSYSIRKMQKNKGYGSFFINLPLSAIKRLNLKRGSYVEVIDTGEEIIIRPVKGGRQ